MVMLAEPPPVKHDAADVERALCKIFAPVGRVPRYGVGSLVRTKEGMTGVVLTSRRGWLTEAARSGGHVSFDWDGPTYTRDSAGKYAVCIREDNGMGGWLTNTQFWHENDLEAR